LETTYEGTKIVKSTKLQMLISKFEEIKMLEDETFDLRNSMVSLEKKSRVSSDEEDAFAMLIKNFCKLMKKDRFKKKFTERLKKVPKEAELEEVEKKDPRGPRCFECSGYGHARADCRNLKQAKGKAYSVTLSDEFEEEETLVKD
jgi:hypothetical protein